MSLHDSFTGVLAVAKDTVFAVADSATVQDAAKAVSQGAVATVADAVENTGFTAKVTLGQVVEFQLTGLLVVFTVLGGLTLMLYLLAWLLKTFAPDQYHCRKAAPAAPAVRAVAASALPAVASIHPGLSDEELVVILAVAAAEGMGQSVTVVKFRPMDSMDWTWSVQGRVGLHSSRKL
ncbi:OadG family transporter subunit [Propionivibrio sp.]|uniref:OadG family transporter subunit n=1 Tax=Propionivibrio sp. TaxID=2212460 RepID=UPI0025CCB0CC|nr:OadG family transporter subunit [Propionivibrio sp.]MBK8744331.1 OadG family protein [Propionivibrio sp.]